MPRNLGNFAGTWNVIVGPRTGQGLTLEEIADETFHLIHSATPSRVLKANLKTFTLNEPTGGACVSLWKDPAFLFGAEAVQGASKFEVWGARRDSEVTDSSTQPSGAPDWRFGEPWTVAVQHPDLPDDLGLPSPAPGSTIELRVEAPNDIRLFNCTTEEELDQLTPNPPNRTLDGEFRSLALWETDGGASRLFAMFQASAQHVREIRRAFREEFGSFEQWLQRMRQQGWQGTLDWYRHLAGEHSLPRLAGFELEALLAAIFQAGSGAQRSTRAQEAETDPIVWGAEEGGP